MTINERECLAYYPFQGDETDVRLLADRFVTTRKPHTCNTCWDPIPAGARVRALTEVNREERKTMTFYFCVPCCDAMAISSTDSGDAIEERTGIGMRRARESRA